MVTQYDELGFRIHSPEEQAIITAKKRKIRLNQGFMVVAFLLLPVLPWVSFGLFLGVAWDAVTGK